MSGQWEVVGKGKKDKTKKLTKSEKKKFIDNAPKVEDLLPLAQVKTLYSALDKDIKKTEEKPVENKENASKKKKQQVQKKEKEPNKENNHKIRTTSNGNLNMLTVGDLTAVIEIGKNSFKETPLVWLKGLASYLNERSNGENNEISFTARSFEHPLCLLDTEIRNLIKKEIKQVHEQNPNVIRALFDYCLTSMAIDLAKGSRVCGFKMLLQLLASQYPSIVKCNDRKFMELKNSYQNKTNIGLSILWALGQSGFKDLSVGLHVWENYMLPLSNLRLYTRFVLDYIKVLLARHTKSKMLNVDQYLSVIDSIHFTDLKLPNSAASELKSHYKILREILFNCIDVSKLHLYFEPILQRIELSVNPLKDDLVKFAVYCLENDYELTFSIWKTVYQKHMSASASILKKIDSEWKSLTKKIPYKKFLIYIEELKLINEKINENNEKSAGLEDCSRICENLVNKMTPQKSSFPLVLLVILTILVAGYIRIDILKNGSFKESSTGKLAKSLGVFPFVETAINSSAYYYNKAYRWAAKTIPIYYKTTSEVSRPYIKNATELAKNGIDKLSELLQSLIGYINEKLPFISDAVGTYGSFLTDKEFLNTLFTNISEYSHMMLHYSLIFISSLISFILDISEKTFYWLQQNVFKGSLSSENIQKIALDGFNFASSAATKVFVWVQNKITELYN